jgi:hypothetical protein
MNPIYFTSYLNLELLAKQDSKCFTLLMLHVISDIKLDQNNINILKKYELWDICDKLHPIVKEILIKHGQRILNEVKT